MESKEQRVARSTPTYYWVGVDDMSEKVNISNVKDFLEALGLDEDPMEENDLGQENPGKREELHELFLIERAKDQKTE